MEVLLNLINKNTRRASNETAENNLFLVLLVSTSQLAEWRMSELIKYEVSGRPY